MDDEKGFSTWKNPLVWAYKNKSLPHGDRGSGLQPTVTFPPKELICPERYGFLARISLYSLSLPTRHCRAVVSTGFILAHSSGGCRGFSPLSRYTLKWATLSVIIQFYFFILA